VETFDELYDRHATPALRLAVLLVGDRDRAEDIVAEAFTRVLPRWRLGEVVDFGPYLRAAVVNEFRGRLRREARVPDQPAPAIEPDDLAGLVADRAALLEALRGLPGRQRAAIVLRYFEDLAERDTAELLGCSVGTVKSSVSRGLLRLRELLEERSHA
jgi:RNA polymerase sigma-70 factor (sigma-E family)